MMSASSDRFGKDLRKAGGHVTTFSGLFSKSALAGAGMAVGFAAARTAMAGFVMVGNAVVDVMQGIAGFALDSIKVGAQFEQMEIAMSSMLGSVGAGRAMMSALQDFAKATPFELGEISGAAKQLIAYGVAQDEVVPTMSMLGDIAAGLSLPLSDLTYLYGTARVQGRLFTRDLNQMTNRGIDVVGMMAQQMGVTKSEILKMTTQGKISFDHMNRALMAMTSTGGIFEGLMSRQVNSVAGAWSNLSDVITIIKAKIGRAFSDSLDLSGLMQGVSGFGEALATAVIPRVQELAAWLGQIDFKMLGDTAFFFGTTALQVFAHVADGLGWFVGTFIKGVSRILGAVNLLNGMAAEMGLPGAQAAQIVGDMVSKQLANMGDGLRSMDSASFVEKLTADIAAAMANPSVLYTCAEAGTVAGESIAEGMKVGTLSSLGTKLMGGAAGLIGSAIGGAKSIWSKLNEPMPDVAREIRSARFADFGGDAVSAAMRESHNLRFRRDQGEGEPKKTNTLLKKILDAVERSDIVQVTDLAS